MLDTNSFEFKYVAYKFKETYKSRKPAMNSIQHTVDQVKSLFNNLNPGKVVSIMKIYNRHAHIRVRDELKRLKDKHRHLKKNPLEMIHHLFHGTRGTSPSVIYQGESGFEYKYSNKNGHHGKGIYFADNAHYSR